MSEVDDILKGDIQRDQAAQLKRDRYRLMFWNFPDVVEDIMRELGNNCDLDPNSVAANTLRNFMFRLADNMGAEFVLKLKDE
jgi:hypothetical protein